jgi:hypothetical protein
MNEIRRILYLLEESSHIIELSGGRGFPNLLSFPTGIISSGPLIKCTAFQQPGKHSDRCDRSNRIVRSSAFDGMMQTELKNRDALKGENPLWSIGRLLRLSLAPKTLLIMAFGWYQANGHGIHDIASLFYYYLAVGIFLWSGLYLLNHWVDIDEDRGDPDKRNRPLARGFCDAKTAVGISLALIAVGLSVSYYLSPWLGILSTLMLVSQLLYSMPPFRFKHRAVLDVMTVGVVNPHDEVPCRLSQCFVGCCLSFPGNHNAYRGASVDGAITAPGNTRKGYSIRLHHHRDGVPAARCQLDSDNFHGDLRNEYGVALPRRKGTLHFSGMGGVAVADIAGTSPRPGIPAHICRIEEIRDIILPSKAPIYRLGCLCSIVVR